MSTYFRVGEKTNSDIAHPSTCFREVPRHELVSELML